MDEGGWVSQTTHQSAVAWQPELRPAKLGKALQCDGQPTEAGTGVDCVAAAQAVQTQVLQSRQPTQRPDACTVHEKADFKLLLF